MQQFTVCAGGAAFVVARRKPWSGDDCSALQDVSRMVSYRIACAQWHPLHWRHLKATTTNALALW